MTEPKKYDARPTGKVKVGNFSEIRNKINTMLEDLILEGEAVTTPKGLVIASMSHHHQKIIKAVTDYLNELEDAYLHGVFVVADTGIKREAIE